MSKRSKIADKLVTLLKTVNGTSNWESNLFNNVYNQLKFYDEVDDYPSVFINTSTETREYLPGGFKWAYLIVTIRVYVEDDNPEAELEKIFDDIEKIVDNNGNMEYSTGNSIEDMKILSITTDEGLLHPRGVGEVTLQIMYDLCNPC